MSTTAARVEELLKLHREIGLSVVGWRELADCYRQLGRHDRATDADSEAAAQQRYLDQLPKGNHRLVWHFTCPSCQRVIAAADPRPLTLYTTCQDCGHKSLTGDFRPSQVGSAPPPAPARSFRRGQLSPGVQWIIIGLGLFIGFRTCSEAQRLDPAGRSQPAPGTSVDEAAAWCQTMNAGFLAQGSTDVSLQAVEVNGKLSHLRLNLPGPVPKPQAEQLGAEVGTEFYRRFPGHPVCINTFVVAQPGHRTVKMVSIKRP
ncbi:MAG: hypothetical protein HUU35_13305 [Armatimonadetes bacterium]|nr:hypothetical protein [Armatimonadota bacterium]